MNPFKRHPRLTRLVVVVSALLFCALFILGWVEGLEIRKNDGAEAAEWAKILRRHEAERTELRNSEAFRAKQAAENLRYEKLVEKARLRPNELSGKDKVSLAWIELAKESERLYPEQERQNISEAEKRSSEAYRLRDIPVPNIYWALAFVTPVVAFLFLILGLWVWDGAWGTKPPGAPASTPDDP